MLLSERDNRSFLLIQILPPPLLVLTELNSFEEKKDISALIKRKKDIFIGGRLTDVENCVSVLYWVSPTWDSSSEMAAFAVGAN